MRRRAGWTLLLICAACACRRGPPVVATLVEAKGTVEQGVGDGWRAIAPIVPFVIGDVVRTGQRSSARVRLAGAGVIRMGDDTRLRFRQGMLPRSSEVGIEVGMAELESEGEMLVATSAGRSRIPAGSRVQVRADAQGARFDVVVGRAILVGENGEEIVQAGEVVRIRVGSAVIEHLDVRIGEATVEVEADTPAPTAAGDAGPPPATGSPALVAGKPGGPAAPALDDEARSLERPHADVTIPAGERATLHAGGANLDVRLRFDHLCPGNGTIELGPRRRSDGSGSAVVRLRTGKVTYRLRCAGDKKVRATVLTLKPDSGNVPLPKHASANTLEADGRRYTVLFQTRPPALVLDWPTAPAGTKDVELHLQGASGERTVPAASARHVLPSGALAEGAYTWWYTTRDGKSSPKTGLQLRFDNTAPTAQFFRTSGETPPGTIALDGVTVPGSKVTTYGIPLSIDEHGRFRGTAEPLPGDDAVAVRVESTPTGVHYYVRRAARGR